MPIIQCQWTVKGSGKTQWHLINNQSELHFLRLFEPESGNYQSYKQYKFIDILTHTFFTLLTTTIDNFHRLLMQSISLMS